MHSGLCWTAFARYRDTAVPAEGNGDLQTLICVLVARPRRCLTLLNPVLWQNWMAAYLGYTLRMRTLFCGWPIMVNDTHTRRRRMHSTPWWHHTYEVTNTAKLTKWQREVPFSTVPKMMKWSPGEVWETYEFLAQLHAAAAPYRKTPIHL